MSASNRPVIVCLSSTDWGFLRYRKQQLMERLSRHAHVVYVNPPRAMKSREWPFRERTRQLSSSLWVHEPFVMPGMRSSAIARQITYGWLAARLAGWRKDRPYRLRVLLLADSGVRLSRRRVFASRHTWDVRIAHIAESLEGVGIHINLNDRSADASASACHAQADACAPRDSSETAA